MKDFQVYVTENFLYMGEVETLSRIIVRRGVCIGDESAVSQQLRTVLYGTRSCLRLPPRRMGHSWWRTPLATGRACPVGTAHVQGLPTQTITSASLVGSQAPLGE